MMLRALLFLSPILLLVSLLACASNRQDIPQVIPSTQNPAHSADEALQYLIVDANKLAPPKDYFAKSFFIGKVFWKRLNHRDPEISVFASGFLAQDVPCFTQHDAKRVADSAAFREAVSAFKDCIPKPVSKEESRESRYDSFLPLVSTDSEPLSTYVCAAPKKGLLIVILSHDRLVGVEWWPPTQ